MPPSPPSSAPSQTPPVVRGTRLLVRVTGLRSRRGVLAASLFRGPNGFPHNDAQAAVKQTLPLAAAANPANPDTAATLVFDNLSPGEWALVLLHDENKNGKMDTGLFGIPKEGCAASNNPKIRTGPPKWKDAKFMISSGEKERVLTVSLVYWGH